MKGPRLFHPLHCFSCRAWVSGVARISWFCGTVAASVCTLNPWNTTNCCLLASVSTKKRMFLDLFSACIRPPQACKFRFQVPSFCFFLQVSHHVLQTLFPVRHHPAVVCPQTTADVLTIAVALVKMDSNVFPSSSPPEPTRRSLGGCTS